MTLILPSFQLGDIKTREQNGEITQLRITTGTYDRAVSTIARNLAGHYQAFDSYGTEGSYAVWSELPDGTYEITWDIYTGESNPEEDAFFYWNGFELKEIGTRSLATNPNSTGSRWTSDIISTQVEVRGGEMTFVALDQGDKTGSSEMRINNIELVEEKPAINIFAPTTELGMIRFDEDWIRATTGGDSVAMSTISRELTGDRNTLTDGVEGSLLQWANLENGTYEVTWRIDTWDSTYSDKVGYYDATTQQIVEFSMPAITNEDGNYLWETGWQTAEVEVTDGELSLVALDVGTNLSSTELFVRSVNFLGNNSLPEPEQSTNPVSWGDVTSQTRFVQGEFLGEFGQWNDPADGYSFYLDEPSVIRFEVQETAGVDVGFEVLYEGELVSDGQITSDTIEVPLEAGESELRLFMLNPFTSVEYDLQFEAIAIPLDPTPPNLGTFTGNAGTGVGGYWSGEPIGGTDSSDEFFFNATDGTYEFTLWPNLRNLAIQLEDDMGVVAQAYVDASPSPTTFTFNLLGNDYNMISGDHSLTITDRDGGTATDYDFAIWKGGDPTNASQSQPTSMPLLDPLTGLATVPITHNPILGEPPYPIPDYPEVDMGNDWSTAADFGEESPWETGIGNGDAYTHGWQYETAHLGNFTVQEYIGGQTVGGGYDATDKVKFELTHDAYLNLFADDETITELVRFNPATGNPEVVASVEYGFQLQQFLTAGSYGLSFSTEGDRIEFSVSGYLSQFDPNYAD
jgi:hypothetical protein